MPFQRTAYAEVVADVIARLADAGLDYTWVGLQPSQQMWLGDYQIVIKPEAAQVDEGSTTGTGTGGTLVRRPVALSIMSRSYQDEAERATQALYDHLAREEQILTALHLYMPSSVVEPIRLARAESPAQGNGVISSVLVFECLYAALLQ